MIEQTTIREQQEAKYGRLPLSIRNFWRNLWK